jgi:catechol 2,3-dioxygenase-like lactoylglutathione lyase family enzyme
MLGNASATAVLPASDMDRAKAFYTEKLGLKVGDDFPGGIDLEAGNGTRIFIYPFGLTTAGHTVAAFRVTDLAAEMVELRAKGVVFDDYDFPGLKTVDGVAELVA